MPRFDAVNLPETIMKKIESLVKGLIVYGLMLAMASSLAAQTPSQSTAKVVRIKGSARYSTGNNVYLPLKVGAASKYEVKIPNGVAGIRGTIYTLSADGVVKVLVGQVVLAYAAPDGTIVTQVVMGGQQFDARTGQITAIPNYDRKEMVKAAKESRIGPNVPAITFTVDHTIYYVSPTRGHNG